VSDPIRSEAALAEALLELQRLSLRLRRDCPWDREQTTLTIVPHTVEEAYEVADAAGSGDPRRLVDELGDLLFQVVFLALLLDEDGDGDLEVVARAVHQKLVRRHPHVFGDAEASTPARVKERWEQIKSEQEGREGIFHDLPGSLPALLHARKAQRRAATVGFDWPDLDGPLAKLLEEVRELEAAIAGDGSSQPESPPDPHVVDEVGDVLFAAVNAARKLGVDPELALRATTRRFVARVEEAERIASRRGALWTELSLEAQERDYQQAKLALADAAAGGSR
jgi:nucleoside triphosphate diphosphatase